MRNLILLTIFLLMTLSGLELAAEQKHLIKTVGTGVDIEIDPQTIPADMHPGYLIMKMYCLSCHGEERMITTLRTGISPVTKNTYGETEFSNKIIKVLRSPKSTLDHKSAKILIEFFHQLITKTKLS